MKTRRIGNAAYCRNEKFWMDRQMKKSEDIIVTRLGRTLMVLYGTPQPEDDGSEPGKSIVIHPTRRVAAQN